MHSRMIELARTETCWREEAANDNSDLDPATGIIWSALIGAALIALAVVLGGLA